MCCIKWVGSVAQSAAEVGLVRELHKLNSFNGLQYSVVAARELTAG
jgi:hypothetical protein